MNKFQLIKETFKAWNRKVFGDLKEFKSGIISRIDELGGLEARIDLNETLRKERVELKIKLEEVVFRDEMFWGPTAKMKWIKEGDNKFQVVSQGCYWEEEKEIHKKV